MSGKKMTGKQAILGGFDLDAFVSAADPSSDLSRDSKDPSKLEGQGGGLRSPRGASEERPTSRPKPRRQPDDLVSERVQLMVSPSELEKIKAQAGLASVSKFLRKFLKEHGLI